jgi:hypothetical protein
VVKTDFRTWHERLGHIGVARLQQLAGGMANGVKFSKTKKEL